MNLGKYQKIYDKLVNRETISYAIAGVLTTLVNFVAFYGFKYLGLSMLGNSQKEIIILTANAIAWFIAVTFAYIVNKKNVFQSKSENMKDEISKIGKFFAARLVTLGVEEIGMYIFGVRLALNNFLVKSAIAVIVIIINYIFSKLFIFKE